MRQEIKLYIGDREVEFSQPPAIYYNYTETDLKNPTIVKNSFSKSITVEGTSINNDIFGHFWNLERYQRFGNTGGPSFNPMQKADFKLFVNGNLYERGYCKLDNVVKSGRKTEYQITLYGGLGDLFSKLSWQDGDSNEKKTLADLVYRPYGDNTAAPLNLDFTINKEAVNEAWEQLNRYTDVNKKWNVINFAMCSEGIPEDFEASKVLINMNPMSDTMTTVDGEYAGVLGNSITGTGYALGETRTELTSDTALDLRSYLLRPVVSVSAIFDAIKDPDNNGGYEIQLDHHFFNGDNPYYIDSWVTLSNLRELGLEKADTSNISVSLSKTSYNWYNINYTKPAVQNNFEFGMNLTITGLGSTTATELWDCSVVKTDATYHNTSDYVKEFEVSQSVFLQVVAYDSNGIEVGRSRRIVCFSETMGNDDYGIDVLAKLGFDAYTGHFFKKNGQWIFCDRYGNPYILKFTLPASINFTSLKLYFKTPRHYKYRLTRGWIDRKDTVNEVDYDEVPYAFYTAPQDLNWSGLHTMDEAFAHNRVQGYYNFANLTLGITTNDYDGFFSGTKVPASKLLHTPYSPAEFLLSYCKLFGLYFYKDPVEDSDDPLIYPNGVVHIVDRHTFYTGEYENIQDRIDRSKQMKIAPTLAAAKWYSFSLEDGGGEAETNYQNKYGYAYGRQLVNTNLAFNNDTSDLYDGNAFKNGVMVQEKNGYFMQPYYGVPVYMYDGVKYNLYKKSGDTYDAKEFSFPIKKFYTSDLDTNGLPYYDIMPKLQIHSEDNGAEDGSGVLLFYNGFLNTPYFNNITDDLPEMGTLCDGNPCWLMTPNAVDGSGNTIAIQRLSIPFFSRDIYENVTTGKIVHSWNFGHPQVTYVPNTFTTDFDCIYDKCWKDYMGDLYDVNTKSVSCYVRLRGKPNPAMLRKWYWFDNAIWRINKISDWNIGSYDPTLVEFIKVQDVDNYDLQQIQKAGRIQIKLNLDGNLTNSAQTLTGQVICQTPSESWFFDEYISWTDILGNSGYINPPTPMTGVGTTNFSISVPANSGSERTYKLKLADGFDAYIPDTYFKQDGGTVLDFAEGSKETTATTAGSQSYILYYVAQNVRADSISATSNESWCSVTAIDTVNKTITFNISATTMPYQRSATITLNGIGTNGGAVNAQTHIYQQGNAVDYYPSEINFDYKDNTYGEITITTSIDWTATINDNNGE